jgi:hypothetical protein
VKHNTFWRSTTFKVVGIPAHYRAGHASSAEIGLGPVPVAYGEDWRC